MTDRELMQQALDALEKLNKDGWILADFEDEVYASIEALRARLAQPEQDPVAWVRNMTDPQPHCVTDLKYMSAADTDAGVQYVPLYTKIEAKLKEKNG